MSSSSARCAQQVCAASSSRESDATRERADLKKLQNLLYENSPKETKNKNSSYSAEEGVRWTRTKHGEPTGVCENNTTR